MINKTVQKGDFLVALPSSISFGDDIFNKSVILVTENTTEGHMGFVLNKSTGLLFSELVPQSSGAFTIYSGGPVENDTLFCIHKCPELIPDSIHIINDIYLGGDFTVILDLIEQGLLSSIDIRFFMGYAGWGEYQLESEIINKNWVVTNSIHLARLFSINTENYWKTAIQNLGEKYAIWLNTPNNPNDN